MSAKTAQPREDVVATMQTERLRALSNRYLGLTLMPTEACNFRCTYCYEDFALGRMTPPVVRGVKNLLAARAPQLDTLHLSWFGGEPLLAVDIVEDIQRHVLALARENPGLRARSSMTTNAWRLERGLFEQLVGLGVNEFQISFDGPEEIHDQKRRRLDGKGTFARIWSNVLAMRDSDLCFRVILRVHVDGENLEAMFGFVDGLKAEFGADPRFGIFLKPLSRYGGPNDAALPILRTAAEFRRFDELNVHAYGSQGRDHIRGAGGSASPEVCYAAKGNSHVVRADGRLCKCTVALEHPANTVGRLHEDGTVAIDAARARPWMRGVFSGIEAELLCPLVGLDAALVEPRASA
ncbi:MAG: radical SAM protein [Planctomycetes bacterium]|nr:radical SAM protein [Planctomycetota bacterium]